MDHFIPTRTNKRHLGATRPQGTKVKKGPELMPRNTDTMVAVRLPLDVCDWLMSLYPDSKSFGVALKRFVTGEHEMYEAAWGTSKKEDDDGNA